MKDFVACGWRVWWITRYLNVTEEHNVYGITPYVLQPNAGARTALRQNLQQSRNAADLSLQARGTEEPAAHVEALPSPLRFCSWCGWPNLAQESHECNVCGLFMQNFAARTRRQDED